YFFALRLDPNHQISETNETNNVVFGATRFHADQPDLSIGQPRLANPTPPYDDAPVAYFGQPLRFEVPVSNLGGATAKDFTVVWYLSDNEFLNGVADPLIGESPKYTLAPGQTITVVLTANVPANSVGGQPLADGAYWFF